MLCWFCVIYPLPVSVRYLFFFMTVCFCYKPRISTLKPSILYQTRAYIATILALYCIYDDNIERKCRCGCNLWNICVSLWGTSIDTRHPTLWWQKCGICIYCMKHTTIYGKPWRDYMGFAICNNFKAFRQNLAYMASWVRETPATRCHINFLAPCSCYKSLHNWACNGI